MPDEIWNGRPAAAQWVGEPRQRRRPPWRVVLVAVVGIAASAGLAWWFSVPESSSFPKAASTATRSPPETASRSAAGEADPDQVRRAWRDVQTQYGIGGGGALGRGASACANRLNDDPALLDYCLAYHIYAAEIVPALQEAWFGDPRERQLALARAALPLGADAAGRVAQVEALTRAIVRESPPQPLAAKPKQAHALRPPPRGTVQKASHAAQRHGERPKTVRVDVRRAERTPRRIGSGPCDSETTEADRLVCANSELAAADRRMKSAYDEAIASGVDPRVLGRDQEAWREQRDRAPDGRALHELYAQRIQELESLAPPH